MPVILFWQHKQLLTFLRISENSKKSICYGVLLLSKASLKASLNQASLKASLNLREFSLLLTNTQQNSCLSRTSLPGVFLGKDVLKICRKSIASKLQDCFCLSLIWNQIRIKFRVYPNSHRNRKGRFIGQLHVEFIYLFCLILRNFRTNTKR